MTKRKKSFFDRPDKRNEDGRLVTRSMGVADAALIALPDENDHDSTRSTITAEHASKRRKTGNDTGVSQKNGNGSGNKPALRIAEAHKFTHMLKLQELQSLLLYCVMDGVAPQWVSVRHHGQIRRAVVLMVPGLEKAMFTGSLLLPDTEESQNVDSEHVLQQNKAENEYQPHASFTTEGGPDEYLPYVLDKERLPKAILPLADVFDQLLPIRAPGDDKYAKLHSSLHAMLTTPISKSREDLERNKNKKGAKSASNQKDWVDQRTSIVEYIAKKDDLLENEYVIHPTLCSNKEEEAELTARRVAAKTTDHDGWKDTLIQSFDDVKVDTKEYELGSITAGCKVLAIDCEMCKVEGGEFALTRISIVDWDGEVVLDEYVVPDKPIIDYLTQFSGITPALLKDVTNTLVDIQTKLLDLITARTILVGHSLDSDLRALKLTHPFIVDTSILYPHPRGAPLKSSLKWLTQKYLSREIQMGHGTLGHNSIEDARATLDLVKQKCEKGPKWGSSEANNESIFKRLTRTPKPSSSTACKTGAVVDQGSGSEKSIGSAANFFIECKDDAEVVEGVKRAVLGDPDGAVIPGGGVDMTWARLRDLEAFRGWRKDNRWPDDPSTEQTSLPSAKQLADAVAQTVNHIAAIRTLLPPCTLMMVYSGSGDPREMARLQQMHRTYKKEFATKKWDELSVQWTDQEEQALRAAVSTARKGVGFVCVS